MIVGRQIVRRFGKLIREAEQETIDAMKEGRLPTEPHITDTFLTKVESTIKENGEIDHVMFKPWYLRDRGPKADKQVTEAEFGADFCGVLDVQLSNFKHSKGFLSQAKMDGHGVTIESTYRNTAVSVSQEQEGQRLRNQIDDMLNVTHESFVIVYSNQRFIVVPATSVKSVIGKGPVYGKPVDSFFKEFLMCFVGDPQLKAADWATLESLRERTKSRTALMLQIVEREQF
jgi:hypothetical protein